MAPRSDRSTQLRVQRFDGVRGVDNPADAFREREERNDQVPVAAPALRDRRILLAPRTLCEGVERGLAGLGISRAIDGPQRLRHALAILPGDKVHGMADQVDDARLDDRLRENGVDGFGEALQAIDDGNENVLGAAVLQLVHDAQPELGALGLLDPDAEDLLRALRQDAERCLLYTSDA